MNIRRVNVDELDTLMSWRMEVLHDVFADSENVDWKALEAANREYYVQEITRGGHIACLYDDEIGCGGLCLYNEMPSPENPSGRCAYLMNIYVRPQYRCNGYGMEIVSWLVNQAKAQGITKIYLESSEDGKGVYQKLGFKEMMDYYKL